MKSIFNKFTMLAGLLSLFQVHSSKELKNHEVGGKNSLSKFTENNFGNLPMKRVGGKWRVKR